MTAQKQFSDWPEERKEKLKAYNQKNYSVVGCKLPRGTADAFRAYCKARGKTVSGMLSEYVKACLSENGD